MLRGVGISRDVGSTLRLVAWDESKRIDGDENFEGKSSLDGRKDNAMGARPADTCVEDFSFFRVVVEIIEWLYRVSHLFHYASLT